MATTPATKGSRAWMWPVGLITLMCGSVGICVMTAVVAARDPSFALEPDYYERALEWDETAAARDASATLGWRAHVEVSIPGAAGTRSGESDLSRADPDQFDPNQPDSNQSEPDRAGSSQSAARVLSIRLTDADGQPVAADRVEVVVFHHALMRERIHCSYGLGGAAIVEGPGALVDAGPGAWAWSLGVARAGVWQVRMRASRGSDQFVTTIDVETPDGRRAAPNANQAGRDGTSRADEVRTSASPTDMAGTHNPTPHTHLGGGA